MKCLTCGLDKAPYHFFSFRGRYDKTFFANAQAKHGNCFECNGPYQCIRCGQVKASSGFRVGGRVCLACKSL